MSSLAAPSRALTRLGYGVGNLAYALPYQASASFLIYFATEILRVPPLAAGLAGALSAVIDAIANPVVGSLSDRPRGGRLGRRHGFLIGGGAGVALLTALFWAIPPAAPPGARIALLVGLLVLLKAALAAFFVPYLALGAELSDDYDERSVLQGARSAFHVAGMLVALVGAPLVFFRSTAAFPKGQLDPSAYPRMGAAFALISAASALACVAATLPRASRPGGTPSRGQTTRVSPGAFARDVRDALGNRDFQLLVATIFLLQAGIQLSVNLGLHVQTYAYGLDGPRVGLVGLTVLGASVLSQPLWVWLARRHERRTALLAGLGLGALGFCGAPWVLVGWPLVPVEGPWAFPVLLGLMAVAGTGNGAFLSIPGSMIADLSDEQELRTSRRDEGLLYGVFTLAHKLGTAFAWLLSGLLLAHVGFVQGAPSQTPAVRVALAVWPTYLLLAVLPPSAVLIGRYSLTRGRWTRLRAALRERAGAGARPPDGPGPPRG